MIDSIHSFVYSHPYFQLQGLMLSCNFCEYQTFMLIHIHAGKTLIHVKNPKLKRQILKLRDHLKSTHISQLKYLCMNQVIEIID